MATLRSEKAIFQLPPNNVDLFIDGRQTYYRSNMEFVDGVLPVEHGGTGSETFDEDHLLAYKDGTFVSSPYTDTYFEEMEERFRVLGSSRIAKADGTLLEQDEKTGIVTLPDFLSHDGGNLSGPLNYSKRTLTFLDGAKGDAFFNSTVTKGKHQVLAKFNSINGVFMDSVYYNQRLIQYMDNATIAAEKNEVTHQVVLLDEAGNTQFPGKVTAGSFTGDLYGTAEYAYDAKALGGKSPAYYLDYINLTNVPDDMNKPVSNAQQAAINAAVLVEKERAQKIEDKLSDDLQTETDRAQREESQLLSNLQAEITRAETAETSTANALADEISRAKKEEAAINNAIATNKPIWDDKYTKNEIENMFSMMEQKIDWKESVDTYADIATTYPNPEDGWRVNVKDTNYSYQFDGEKWVPVSANAIPLATQETSGLLSKDDKIAYDDANTKKHTHSNHVLLEKLTDTMLDKVPNVATDDQTPTFQESLQLEELESGEEIKFSFGKIAKAIKELISHIGNKENPHGLTLKQLKIENIDNTSDEDKPVSTAQQEALDLKAPLESPVFTGIPQVPTADTEINNDQVASTKFVHDVIDDMAENKIGKDDFASDTNAGIVKLDGYSIVTNDDGQLTMKYINAIGIGVDTDLNDLLTPGHYYCQTVAIAQTLLNCPVQRPFSLDVKYASGAFKKSAIQRLTASAVGNYTMTYVRNVYSDGGDCVAGEWSLMYDENNKPPVNGMTTYYSIADLGMDTSIKHKVIDIFKKLPSKSVLYLGDCANVEDYPESMDNLNGPSITIYKIATYASYAVAMSRWATPAPLVAYKIFRGSESAGDLLETEWTHIYTEAYKPPVYTYTHPTTPGNKHIPAGGSSGQILRWSADGTAVWGADNNTTYAAATTSANGLMTSTDKLKCNLITLASGNASGTFAGNITGNAYSATCIGGVQVYNSDPGVDTTYHLGSNGGNNGIYWIHRNNECVGHLGRNGNAGVPMTFNWSGQGGYPSWYWGGSDGTNMYVYNPLNLPFLRNDVAVSTSNVITANAAINIRAHMYVGSYSASPYSFNQSRIFFYNSGGGVGSIYGGSGNLLDINPTGNTDGIIQMGIYDNTHTVKPYKTAMVRLGHDSYRWGVLFTNSTVNISSDKRVKKDFTPLPYDKIKGFLKDVTPMWFRYLHTPDTMVSGMIAQEVEMLLKKWNLPSDYGIITKTPVKDSQGKPTGDYTYGMCYEQFIPLLLLIMQKELMGKEDTSIDYEGLGLPMP